MVGMEVLDVRRGQAEDGQALTHFVLLNEVSGERSFPIGFGEAEATALALHRGGVPLPRPLTSAFESQVLGAAGEALGKVGMGRLDGDVFSATAVVAGPDGDREVDARP